MNGRIKKKIVRRDGFKKYPSKHFKNLSRGVLRYIDINSDYFDINEFYDLKGYIYGKGWDNRKTKHKRMLVYAYFLKLSKSLRCGKKLFVKIDNGKTMEV